MEFMIYNSNVEPVGIIDVYSSVIWTRRYNAVDDFELYVHESESISELCQIGRYIIRTDDGSAMIIKNVRRSESYENGNYITITGEGVETILRQRIVWGITTTHGRVESVARMLVEHNAIDTANDLRNIPLLSLGASNHLPAEIGLNQFIGGDLLETVKMICDSVGYGFEVKFQNGGFVFNVINGVDHTTTQNATEWVLFDAESMGDTETNTDATSFKNAVLIGGAGDGLGRVFASVGTAAGLDRFETYTEQSDSDETALRSFGKEYLNACRVFTTFDGEVVPNCQTYGVPWSLGDVVTVQKNGVTANPRIIEVITSIDESGVRVVPTFSEIIL